MHNVLVKIVEKKQEDLVEQKKNNGLFKEKIQSATGIALIAEVKFASPAHPHLGSHADLLARVAQYEAAGADAISLITEPHFFKGDIAFVEQVKEQVSLPVLQKDFVIDPYQIYEAKVRGSDAILLIARLVDAATLTEFVSLAQTIGIEPVVEIASEEDLKKALKTTTEVIAVNARDLDTFVIDVSAACSLIKKIPDNFIKLGFSGIHSAEEVTRYKNAGANGVLVGTSLMKAKDTNYFIRSLRGIQKIHAPVRESLKTKIKICGVRTVQAAEAAIVAGAEYIGFNFVPASKRYIDPKAAQKIMKKIKGKIQIVGVFQNEKSAKVNKIAELVDLDYIQLHGEEDEAYMKTIKRSIIKTITTSSEVRQTQESFFLIDRPKQGEGSLVNSEQARHLAQKYAVFLAGGLTPENVGTIVKNVQPYAVDVAGGIETDGKEDLKKIQQFIKQVKGATQ